MTALHKGLIVASVHVAMVASIGAKLLIDRERLPRAWVLALPYDPNLPIRGRYVRLKLRVHAAPDLKPTASMARDVRMARLTVENGEVVAHPADDGELCTSLPGGTVELWAPAAFFIPEHIPDPSRRPDGEELWVEVTVPGHGPPRPIRLGVKKDGVLTPLAIQ